ncbi:hypothetical protein BCS42_02745 [Crenothrix sp. D3]|nr:hypothetical protein BCS42_02745 [Crenothrix sp. D3]
MGSESQSRQTRLCGFTRTLALFKCAGIYGTRLLITCCFFVLKRQAELEGRHSQAELGNERKIFLQFIKIVLLSFQGSYTFTDEL